MADPSSIRQSMPIDPDKLIAAREALGLNQIALAKRLGWKQQQLSRIENGLRADPRLSTIEQLSRVLGVSIETLLGKARKPSPRKPKPPTKDGK